MEALLYSSQDTKHTHSHSFAVHGLTFRLGAVLLAVLFFFSGISGTVDQRI